MDSAFVCECLCVNVSLHPDNAVNNFFNPFFSGDEAKELKDEIERAQRAASDADKQRKRLAMEKDELVSALEDAESALEQEEAKVLNAQQEIQHIRQEFERRLSEKDEDFEATR